MFNTHVALGRKSEGVQAWTHYCSSYQVLVSFIQGFMEEHRTHASTGLTCQEFCNAFEPSEGICCQTVRFEGKIKWNRDETRRKRNEWWQAVEGNQILNNQAGQKMTLEAGRARKRKEAIFQRCLGYLGYSCMVPGDLQSNKLISVAKWWH